MMAKQLVITASVLVIQRPKRLEVLALPEGTRSHSDTVCFCVAMCQTSVQVPSNEFLGGFGQLCAILGDAATGTGNLE